MATPEVVVKSKKIDSEVPMQWIAEEIEKISRAVETLKKSRITIKLLVAIIHHDTGVAKGTIEEVLTSCQYIESRYLKS